MTVTGAGPGAVAVGSEAPELALRDQHGQLQTLADRRGSRSVLLVFYPFAFTGVCTGEMRALQEKAWEWERRGTDVLAVSCDFTASLRAFADAERLSFSLLSDFWPHGAVSRAYGVFDEQLGAATRGSFVIDRDGVVRWVVRNAVPDARDVTAYAEALSDLSRA